MFFVFGYNERDHQRDEGASDSCGRGILLLPVPSVTKHLLISTHGGV